MARERGKAHYAFGVCKNLDMDGNGTPCPKCLSKEEIKISYRDEFVCPECGEPLTKIEKNSGNWKKIAIGGVAAAALLGGGAYFAFSGGESPEPTPITITLNKEKATMSVGEKDTLNAIINPDDKGYTIKWASNNPKVATVDNGIVTFIAEGEVKIGVQINEHKEAKDICEYVVKAKPTEPIEKPETPVDKPTTINIKYPYGEYNGEGKNGKPHGQGRLVYTKEHVINSHDIRNRTAKPGEYIQGQFVNGEITIGRHFDAKGNLIQALNFGVAPSNED